MRKKISLLLCAVAVMLCFTACADSSKETVDYNEAAIQQTTEFMIEYCANADDASIEQWRSMREFSMELQLTQAGLPVTPESFLGALDAWQAAVDECGAYESHGDYTFETTNDKVKAAAEAQFADRDAVISFVFDENSYLESMTVDAKYSTGEILKKAGLNTILGMGTVFVVLIFISFLISLFRFIPDMSGKKKVQETKEAPVQSAVETAPVVPETDDTELIAVIAAAIAAAREEAGVEDAEGFFVRSIRRRPSNKWKA